MGQATIGKSLGTARIILTPSSRKVDSRSARTPLITTAASHGSAAPAGCAASSRKWLVISAARRTSPCSSAGALGIEGAAVQQVGEGADGGKAVVQGIENVR